MSWQVFVAAPPIAVPTDGLPIEREELAAAEADVSPNVCTSEAELVKVAPGVDGLITLGVPLSRETLVALCSTNAKRFLGI